MDCAFNVGINDGVVTLTMNPENYGILSAPFTAETFGQDTVKVSAISDTTNGIGIIKQKIGANESILFDYKIDKLVGWHGIGYRLNSDSDSQLPHYAVIISKDKLELQKFSKNLIIMSATANRDKDGNTLIEAGKWYRIELSVKNTTEGVRVRLFINGVLILEALDTDSVTMSGGNVILYVSRTAANGSMYLRAVPSTELTSNDMVTYHTLAVSDGTGSGYFEKNHTVSITADAAPVGKKFSRWNTSSGIVLADDTAASTTATMPDCNASITAMYVDDEEQTTLSVIENQQLTLFGIEDQNGHALREGENYTEGTKLSFIAGNTKIFKGMPNGLYYVPVSWNVNVHENWPQKMPGEDYTASFSTTGMASGMHTLTVTCALTPYDAEKGWGTPDLTKTETKTIEFALTQPRETGDTETPTPGADVSTGGSNRGSLWSMVFETAWVAFFACLVIHRRKYKGNT